MTTTEQRIMELLRPVSTPMHSTVLAELINTEEPETERALENLERNGSAFQVKPNMWSSVEHEPEPEPIQAASPSLYDWTLDRVSLELIRYPHLGLSHGLAANHCRNNIDQFKRLMEERENDVMAQILDETVPSSVTIGKTEIDLSPQPPVKKWTSDVTRKLEQKRRLAVDAKYQGWDSQREKETRHLRDLEEMKEHDKAMSYNLQAKSELLKIQWYMKQAASQSLQGVPK